MSVLIHNVLIPDGGSTTSASVHLKGDRIHQVYFASASIPVSDDTWIDGRDKLLLPGFVNAHTHSSQVWQRGLIPQLPLELWLADVFDSTPTNLEQFYLGAVSTAVDTLLSGGTCLIDHAYVVPGQELETVAALVKGYKQVGIRAFIAPLIQDLPFVAGLPKGCTLPHHPYPRSTTDILSLMEAIIKQFHDPDSGIYIALGPTGFHRCSDELLVGCADLGNRFNLCFHTHLLETRAQQQLARERYGETAVQHLQRLGVLGDRTTLAHSVWLTADDIAILAQTGATVVHNPVSNLRLGSGIAPILKCLQAGVNVAFGCDGAASNDAQSLLEVVKLSTILHTVTDPDYQHWLSPHTILQMAAQNGARGVGLEQLGIILSSNIADVVLYNLAHPSLLPCNDPLQLLVLGRPTDVVERVWVNGKLIVEEGSVKTVDVAALHQKLRDRTRYAQSHQSLLLNQIETHYRQMLL